MKNEDKFFNNSIYDEQAAAFSEKQLTDPMQYQEGMEIIDSDIFDKVQTARAAYDYNKYTEADVLAARSQRAYTRGLRGPAFACRSAAFGGDCPCRTGRAPALLRQ